MKRICALLAALVLLGTLAEPASAAEASLYVTEDNCYEVTVKGTAPGSNYLLIWLGGAPEKPEEGSINSTAYIRQATADGNEVRFEAIRTLAFRTASVFVIDEEGTVLCCGTVHSGVPGDLNENGTADGADIDLLLEYLAGISYIMEPMRADMNGDGRIDVSDARYLEKKIQ